MKCSVEQCSVEQRRALQSSEVQCRAVKCQCFDLVLSIICSAGIFAASTSPILPIPYSGKVAEPTVNIWGRRCSREMRSYAKMGGEVGIK